MGVEGLECLRENVGNCSPDREARLAAVASAVAIQKLPFEALSLLTAHGYCSQSLWAKLSN